MSRREMRTATAMHNLGWWWTVVTFFFLCVTIAERTCNRRGAYCASPSTNGFHWNEDNFCFTLTERWERSWKLAELNTYSRLSLSMSRCSNLSYSSFSSMMVSATDGKWPPNSDFPMAHVASPSATVVLDPAPCDQSPSQCQEILQMNWSPLFSSGYFC